MVKPVIKNAPLKHKYSLMTGPSVNPSVPGFPVGGLLGLCGISRVDKPWISATYYVMGAGGSLSRVKFGLFNFISEPSTFESTVSGVDQFSGEVDALESSVQAIFGYGWQSWEWLGGTAKGTTCEGWGGSINGAVGVTLRARNRLILRLASVGEGTPWKEKEPDYSHHSGRIDNPNLMR